MNRFTNGLNDSRRCVRWKRGGPRNERNGRNESLLLFRNSSSPNSPSKSPSNSPSNPKTKVYGRPCEGVESFGVRFKKHPNRS